MRTGGASRYFGNRVRRPGLLLALGAIGLGFLVELIAILKLNSGHFTYTLDDPYIHLALAQRLREGHYGINPGEPAAPSSSILWPFLLVPVAGAAVGEFLPLLLGILAAAATVVVYHRILATSVLAEPVRSDSMLISVLVVLLALATNVIGLPFTGMEHSLQVLLAAVVVLGLIREAETGQVRPWLVPAIAAGPLVRYESLAVSAAATLYLWLRGHRRPVLVAGIATLVPIGLFSAFLANRGLGLLPGSVLLKAPTFSSDEPVPGTLASLRTTLRDPTGVLLGLVAAWMLSVAVISRRIPAERALGGSVALAAALHAIAGRYGAYHRWELYVVAVVLLALLFLERRVISDTAARYPAPLVAAIGALWCVVVGGRYLFGLGTLPVAANNIYEQQYQMHRYVSEFERAPVAVNDLGYVSFGNRHYVLDLVGMGTPEILTQPEGAERTRWVEHAVTEHGIETAMIYDEWFEELPRPWRKVGEIHLSRPKITPAWEKVSFYATSEAAYPRVRDRVSAFRATLPPRVDLAFAK